MRGNFKGKIGEVTRVDRNKIKVYIIGIEQIKKDGNKTQYPINPSNLMITELKLDDKNRIKSMGRK